MASVFPSLFQKKRLSEDSPAGKLRPPDPVRTDDNFEAWIRFFLEGIREVSRMVLQTTKRIQALERTDSDRLVAHGEGSHGLALLRGLMRQPVVMANDVARIVGVSYTKANSLISVCEDLGILRQINSGKRNRKFIYNDYVGILGEGTEIGPGEV
jgi:Fic family protein